MSVPSRIFLLLVLWALNAVREKGLQNPRDISVIGWETRLNRRNDQTLLRTYRDGQSKIDGLRDDYAFLIQGLIDLYEDCFDTPWLDLAGTLQERLK
jgi:hypothetical protein